MSYKISSDDFDHPLLKPLLEVLNGYFSGTGLRFYVIGATARDIIMQAHDEKSGRATQDLDIAVAVSDWKEYQKVENEILNIEGFTKDTKQKQRFIYKEIFLLDIIPFGDIMQEDDKIFWPPDESIAMSVLGFIEVAKATRQVVIDENLTVEVASLAGIFLLKIVAWEERHIESSKDADDMGLILANYLSINESRAVEEYFEIYEADDFSITTGGAKLLGKDISEILYKNTNTKDKIRAILQREIDQQTESKLINQVLETNKSYRYEEVLTSLENIVSELIKR